MDESLRKSPWEFVSEMRLAAAVQWSAQGALAQGKGPLLLGVVVLAALSFTETGAYVVDQSRHAIASHVQNVMERGAAHDLALDGVIIDANSGDLVTGVRVYAWPSSACGWSVLAAEGAFSFTCREVEVGDEIEIFVTEAPDYERWTGSIVVTEDATTTVRVELMPIDWGAFPSPTPTTEDGLTDVRVTGRVMRGSLDGGAVAGAKVAVVTGATCLGPVESDAHGFFEILCPAANYLVGIEVVVTAAGYRPWRGYGGLGRWTWWDFDVVLEPDSARSVEATLFLPWARQVSPSSDAGSLFARRPSR